jgi:hypothetical protein
MSESGTALSRPADDHHFDFLADRFSYLRLVELIIKTIFDVYPNRNSASPASIHACEQA